MANTQVFTLGVTSDQALGRSVDSLRGQVERLRRQADGTRLGRLIGEVIRLGLELDKVGQAERQLDNDQAWTHKAQIDRLRREGNEVERLRRLYLSLGRKPLELRAMAVASSAPTAKESPAPTLEQRKAALLEGTSPAPRPARGDPPEPRSAEQGRVPLESANAGLAVLKAGAVGAGTVAVAAGTAWGARSYYQSRTSERQSEITKGLKENGGKAAAKGLTKLGLVMLKDKGEDKAEAVGAALGGVLGNLGAELLGGLTKNKQIQKYGGEIGEMIGEGVGGFLGKKVFGWFSDTPAANDAPGKDKAAADASAQRSVDAPEGTATPSEQTQSAAPESAAATQERPPEGPANGAREIVKGGLIAAGALGGTAFAAWGARTYQGQSPDRRSEITSGLRENGGKAAAKGVTKLGLAVLKDKSEDQAEAVGAAFGSVLGSFGAELLGGVTKNKRIQKYGGEIGEMIGEGLGGLAGKTLHGLFSDKPTANDAPADKAKTPVARMPKAGDDAEEPEEEEEEEEVDEVEDEAAFFEAQEAVQDRPPAAASAASAAGLASTAFTGQVGRAVAGNAGASVARRVFRRIPGANLLDTGLQLAETYNSDAPPEQKLEGYGTAVGGLGGGLAGAAAGAAIGSVVPVIGTAIGGLIGGVLGSMGGETIGGWLGKALGSGKEEPAAKPGLGEAARAMDSPAPQPPLPAPPVATATPAVPPAPINQQFTFTANMPVTFSNSLDDPSVLQQLEAIARRQLEELMRQARSAQLADTPHIAL
ncbi:hypothetical protein [Pseudomonas mosselii]|uniref:hypothetical protein n=1 Tax=Pseudomonas mosselii TaxID=78327 RepID=UPI002022E3B2|nr:hypothetical protein [Pseudomonas mosselii]MCL8301425.1 hypothetical protein [Pseudomonas mosselii]MCL8341052.1 hypothetical protein [Pseudomonas mosselii]MCU9527653.1 hypothetical protein [Pseudomonas mosselii]MCU9536261.1 hypothetical protein [Pseudomonas mosselii]MCU9540797.1 hypothetical protein [Pseudomonas mosselii]